eukprot:gnl/Chilomastix_cuspidata/430.p1 GENE.gnl/Chilomastix_cuspidata/430~~gnl/Chilomastix_cuspidata/430.p1  ORF type:complete len:737 (+),score=307.48 gnl/Chilomastix_cuspidata/430:541-2751(+)
MKFSQLPEVLRYKETISVEESRVEEFKAIQFSKSPIQAIISLARKYINAFLNTEGGNIWFGIEDDGTIKGIYFSDIDVSALTTGFRRIIDNVTPRIDRDSVQMSFLRVEGRTNHSVVVIQVFPGQSPVYFTNRYRNKAYIRRDGGCARLNASAILQRVSMSRGGNGSMVPRPSFSMVFTGRTENINNAIEFFTPLFAPHSHQKWSESVKPHVLVLHGIPSTGKRTIAKHIVQALQVKFRINFTVTVSLPHAAESPKSASRIMTQIIRGVDPSRVPTGLIDGTPLTPRDAPLAAGEGAAEFDAGAQGPSTPPPFVEPKTLQEALRGLSLSVSHPSATLMSRYSELFPAQRAVIVITGLGSASIISDLVPRGQRCAFVITTDKRPNLDHIKEIEVRYESVQPLGEEASVALAMALAPGRIDGGEAAEIAELCHGLPSAITVICASLSTRPELRPAAVIAALRKMRPRRRIRSIASEAFAFMEKLPGPLLESLLSLCVFHGPFSVDAAAAVLERIDGEARTAPGDSSSASDDPAACERAALGKRHLAELAAHSLVSPCAPSRYQISSFVGEWARSLDGAAVRRRAARAVFAYFLRLLRDLHVLSLRARAAGSLHVDEVPASVGPLLMSLDKLPGSPNPPQGDVWPSPVLESSIVSIIDMEMDHIIAIMEMIRKEELPLSDDVVAFIGEFRYFSSRVPNENIEDFLILLSNDSTPAARPAPVEADLLRVARARSPPSEER